MYEEVLPAVPEILVVPPVTRDAAEADLVPVPEGAPEAYEELRVPVIEVGVDEPMEEFIAADPLRPCTEPWLPKNCCCPLWPGWFFRPCEVS